MDHNPSPLSPLFFAYSLPMSGPLTTLSVAANISISAGDILVKTPGSIEIEIENLTQPPIHAQGGSHSALITSVSRTQRGSSKGIPDALPLAHFGNITIHDASAVGPAWNYTADGASVPDLVSNKTVVAICRCRRVGPGMGRGGHSPQVCSLVACPCSFSCQTFSALSGHSFSRPVCKAGHLSVAAHTQGGFLQTGNRTSPAGTNASKISSM